MKAFIKNYLTYIFSSLIMSSFVFSSCKETTEIAVGDPSEISFAVNAQSGDEAIGTVKVNISLDKPQNVRTVLNYRVAGNAISTLTSLQEADLELITEPPIIIPKGETSTFIEFRVLEDENFEPELENIIFELDAVLEGNAVLSEDASKLTHTFNILENDYKLFLEWDNPDGNVDMSLYVELPNKKLLASENSTEFEEITIANARENEQYYVDVWMNKGEGQANYSLKCLKAGSVVKETLLKDHFIPASADEQDGRRSELLKNYLLVRAGKDLKIL